MLTKQFTGVKVIFSIDTDLIINHGQKDEKIKGIKMHCETIGKDEVLLMPENDKKVKFKIKTDDIKEMLKYLG